jgi:hypothetical protein
MADILVQLNDDIDDILGGKPVQTRQRDMNAPLLLDFKASDDTVNAATTKRFKLRTPRSSTHVWSVSMVAPFCCTCGPHSLGPNEEPNGT